MNVLPPTLARLAEILAAPPSSPAWRRMYQAYELAAMAHDGQRRAHGTPYIDHPLTVALILVEALGVTDEDAVCAALLHDVVEDSEVTAQAIETSFGPRVASLVRALTKAPKGSGGRASRNAVYYHALTQADPLALAIKVADRLQNLADLPQHPSAAFRRRYLDETKQHILPLAEGLSARAADLVREAMARAAREAD